MQMIKIYICNILSLNINVMQKFQDIKFVGEGSFSTVYRARRKIDGKTYALKKMSLSCLSHQQKFNCLNQIKLLARLSHPNIIQYKDAFFQEDNLYLVTQFAQNGDFLQYMMKRRKQRSPLTQEEICVFARQMANGLNGLHKTNILHRDVKAANFFLTNQNKVKLGDMNVSLISRNGMATTKIGTPYYTSPQIWQELPYSFKSDIWSFGCLLYEMITFTHPFSGKQINQLKNNILKNSFRELPSQTPQPLRLLIQKCLRKNPKQRPTSQQLLKDEYLKLKYNEYHQKTMQKSKKNDKQYKITCMRILKDITQSCNSVDITKSQLPKSNYFSNSKKKNIIQIKEERVMSGKSTKSNKANNQKLIAIFNIYNVKPPGFLPAKTPTRYSIKAKKLR